MLYSDPLDSDVMPAPTGTRLDFFDFFLTKLTFHLNNDITVGFHLFGIDVFRFLFNPRIISEGLVNYMSIFYTMNS